MRYLLGAIAVALVGLVGVAGLPGGADGAGRISLAPSGVSLHLPSVIAPAAISARLPSAIAPIVLPGSSPTGANPSARGAVRAPWPAPKIAVPLMRPAAARPSSALQNVVERAVAGRKGHFGVVVHHLTTGESAAVNADDVFRSASLYKLPVLLTVFKDLAAGTVTWDEPVTMTKAIRDREPYATWKVGKQVTLGEAVEQMITVSSNDASAVLLDRLGGEARITAEMVGMGLRETYVGSERAYTSPANVAEILRSIATGEAVNRSASQAMLDLLVRQRVDDRLPAALAPEVLVAHKTGELPKLRHDAGIVYLDSGPYLVVAMAEDAASNPEARAFIVDLSRSLRWHFAPGAIGRRAQSLMP